MRHLSLVCHVIETIYTNFSFLSRGGANLAAVGQFYSDPNLQIPKDKDYRYMPNVISSPIVDAPLSEIMTDTLNKRNKVHTLDLKTVEDMRAMFWHDVEGRPRNNKRLLPRRNWCSIREYTPGMLLFAGHYRRLQKDEKKKKK